MQHSHCAEPLIRSSVLIKIIKKNKNMSNSLFTYVTSPLDQFEIRNLLSLDAPILGNLQISLTNIGLYLTIGTVLILTLNVLATNYNKVISNS